MRRIAPWLPIAIALATLSVGALRAVAQETTEGPIQWHMFVPHMILVLGLVPYVIPMLLLAWAKSVRRRSAAPPVVGRGTLALALPALIVAALWPLGTGIALLVHCTPVARALLVDHRLACIAIWTASVAATALWVVGAASRWLWWPRPVAVEAAGPYR
jgi:hypothetical protein